MTDLAELKAVLAKARHKRDTARAEMEYAELAVERAKTTLRTAGINPDKDVSAQLVTLNKRAVKAAEEAKRIMAEMEDALS